MSKAYDYKALIDAMLERQRTQHIHEDFKNYYAGLIEKLEEMLEMKLKPGEDDPIWEMMPFSAHWTLTTLFDDVTAHLGRHITGGWLEGGPGVTLYKMKEKGSEQASITMETMQKMFSQHDAVRATCKQLLYDLFKLWYGDKTQKTVTSDDLLKAGFDDSKEPQMRDYYDYL